MIQRNRWTSTAGTEAAMLMKFFQGKSAGKQLPEKSLSDEAVLHTTCGIQSLSDSSDRASRKRNLVAGAVCLLVLAGIWGASIWAVNPNGEFMINDDWCFVRALEGLISQGRLDSTGWGPAWAPGGPSLITHLLWGWLFQYIGGFSITTLRLSVLAAGMIGSAALLIMLRSAKASSGEALWATLTLMMNPLFFSQCFTFMTDITLAAMMSCSLLFLHSGTRTGSTLLLAAGLFFSLAAVLTRQIGIVIPLAFVLTCFLHPAGVRLGRWKIVLLVAGIVVIPWLTYEGFLFGIGSTPLTEHQVIQSLWRDAPGRGLLITVRNLCSRFALEALPYVCFFVSPVLALRYRRLLSRRFFVCLFLVVTASFAVFAALLMAGVIDARVVFLRNVLYDAGIGPLLLKDTYILKIIRGPVLPKPLYYVLVYWSIVSVAAWIWLASSSLSRVIKNRLQAIESVKTDKPAPTADDQGRSGTEFVAYVSLVAGILYCGIISLTGFHDRYLIPVCLLFIVWLLLDRPPVLKPWFGAKGAVLGLVPLAFMAFCSIGATHDFMTIKRAQKNAQDFIVYDRKANPCDCDGGMEFNGYHCYRSDFKAVPGLSWWWVTKEDYLLTLGPLRGYEVIRTFPFTRFVGSPGAVHVLKPAP